MANVTYHCAAQGCKCNVANDESSFKNEFGIFCSQECAEGKGCGHAGCDCAAKAKN